MNFAVLLAGGAGSRVSSKIPKQYIKAGGHMMITHSLKALAASFHISYVYIVAKRDMREEIMGDAVKAGLDEKKIKGFADPGSNRQYSIINAMEEIRAAFPSLSGEDTVFVHDAARPFLSEKLIDDCYKAIKGHDGVIPVLPMKDTVYLSSSGKKIEKLLDRSQIYSGQAPELFLLQKYYEANMRLSGKERLQINGSSEPAVMAGMDIAMIAGDESNIKVTTDSDLKIYEKIFGGRDS